MREAFASFVCASPEGKPTDLCVVCSKRKKQEATGSPVNNYNMSRWHRHGLSRNIDQPACNVDPISINPSLFTWCSPPRVGHDSKHISPNKKHPSPSTLGSGIRSQHSAAPFGHSFGPGEAREASAKRICSPRGRCSVERKGLPALQHNMCFASKTHI